MWTRRVLVPALFVYLTVAETQKGDNATMPPGQGPSDEYKKLQTELNKAREENRRLQQQLLNQAETQAAVKRLEEFVLSDPPVEDEADDRVKTFKTRREQEQAALQIRGRLLETLEKSETDWSDPRLEGARSLWDAGDYAGAEKVVQSTLGVGGGTGDQEIEARVAAEVQKALKSRGLGDKGDTTGGSAFPSTLAELNERMGDNSPAGKKWWTENKAAVLSELGAGKIT